MNPPEADPWHSSSRLPWVTQEMREKGLPHWSEGRSTLTARIGILVLIWWRKKCHFSKMYYTLKCGCLIIEGPVPEEAVLRLYRSLFCDGDPQLLCSSLIYRELGFDLNNKMLSLLLHAGIRLRLMQKK